MESATPLLSADEATLYDRQIRLWGVEAQGRLGKANILFCGFTAVQSEICKNLVLAGIKSVMINDTRICEHAHTGAHLFLNHLSVGKNCGAASQDGVKALNPLVVVSRSSLPMDQIALTFDQYHLVCISGCTPEEIIIANTAAREKNTYFFNVDTFGYFGYMFQDLGQNYSYEIDQKDQEKRGGSVNSTHISTALETKNTSPLFIVIKSLFQFYKKYNEYPSEVVESLQELKNIKNQILVDSQANIRAKNKVPDSMMETFVNNLGTELSPVCAIVGGVVAQEILKIICHNDKPFNNSFFFNGLDDSASVAELL
jgi:ubiquitin-like 1-activating enzyme E1 A